MATKEEKITAFRDYVKKLTAYHHALAVLYWDMRTKAPRKGMDARAEVLGLLSAEQFQLSTSPQMEEYLLMLEEEDTFASLDPITQANVRECRREFDRSKKIPPNRYQEFVVLTAQAATIWEEAREKNDFAMYRPYLEKIVSFTQEFVDYWGYQEHKYNTLLDLYEPEMTVAQLDQIFAVLREKTVPLVAAITSSPHQPDTSILTQTYPEAEQEAFSRYILEKIGYDFAAGRLDRSVHPFATSFAPGDVRITTRFAENDFAVALFSCIHEAGHAIYEQNISPELFGTLLCDGVSMGIHESQSRYLENMVGRSRPFWKHFFPAAQQAFPQQLGNVDVEQFYRAINHVSPSYIRTEADEVTYNLHVMLRYEIEKELINGTLEVGELPQVWNQKMEEYLGITPPTDTLGVLQDVHWSDGSFGYFPTYTLGNVYAAQFAHTMKQQISGYEELIATGELAPIRQWLKEKIHQHGKLKSPRQLLLEITGETANATYLVNYLEQKFGEIYQL